VKVVRAARGASADAIDLASAQTIPLVGMGDEPFALIVATSLPRGAAQGLVPRVDLTFAALRGPRPTAIGREVLDDGSIHRVREALALPLWGDCRSVAALRLTTSLYHVAPGGIVTDRETDSVVLLHPTPSGLVSLHRCVIAGKERSDLAPARDQSLTVTIVPGPAPAIVAAGTVVDDGGARRVVARYELERSAFVLREGRDVCAMVEAYDEPAASVPPPALESDPPTAWDAWGN
jgi:hypothetical protein